MNFQFVVEARLWSFFLKHGGYHGFDGNKSVKIYLILLFKTVNISLNRLNFQFDVEVRLCSFFLEEGRYHGFDGNEPGLLFLHFFL